MGCCNVVAILSMADMVCLKLTVCRNCAVLELCWVYVVCWSLSYKCYRIVVWCPVGYNIPNKELQRGGYFSYTNTNCKTHIIIILHATLMTHCI